MANICSTEINIQFENLKDAKTVLNKINEWRETDDGKPATYVEYIRDNSHTCDDWEVPPYGRGDIIDMTLDNKTKQININLDCKWSPVVYVFDVMLRKTFPDMNFDILYRAEEPGMDIYFTNDTLYINTWIVDCCSDKINDVFYVETQDEVESILRDVLPKYPNYKKMKFPELIAEAQDKDLAYVHQYDEMPIDELD